MMQQNHYHIQTHVYVAKIYFSINLLLKLLKKLVGSSCNYFNHYDQVILYTWICFRDHVLILLSRGKDLSGIASILFL